MQVFRPELHVFPLRAYLDATKDVIGAEGLEALLAPYGITPSALQDPNAWVSLEFAEAFLRDSMRVCNDPDLLERGTRLGMTPKYMGALLPLLTAIGTPLSLFQGEARAAARFNKTGTWVFETGRPGFVRMSFRLHPHIKREQQDTICRIRLLQNALIPTLFDRPAGTVEHPRCMLRGDDACVYEITWSEPPKRSDARIGLAAGFAISSAIAVLAPLDTWVAGALIALCSIGGWLFGRLRVVRAELTSRVQEIGSHNEALAKMMRANEERFAELLEAKAEVDAKVEQRTHELRGATQKLSEALNQLQELDRAKTDFFNNVSHELRSPLTLILAPLDELLAGRTPAGSERAAYETIYRNASRLLRLINQLLDLAKIDAGEMRLAQHATDLIALVRNGLQGFEAAARRKRVAISLHSPESMAHVVIDPAWIESALTNLVANALRWTPSGGSVRVRIEDCASHVTIAVADDGPGVASADKKTIFERFSQGDNARSVIGGTGIGLALVREAARLHGGDVELQSELGKGATFTIKLPRTAAPDVAPAERSMPSLPAARMSIEDVQDAPPSSDRPGPGNAAPLALVVEDNPELRSFIADVLATRYRVRTAADGVQGLELARSCRPDVIVSDVAMPEMDGYELCRQLRQDDETKSVPVLLVTARTEVSSVLTGFEAGANDYLLKPFHATELLARVDVHVRLRRLVSQLARQERLAALGSLAASVAHNVRNPLSALISGLPAIRNRLAATLDPATAELLGVMLDCAERIERMTLDLLDLSRIDREASGDFSPGAGLLACTRMIESRLTFDVALQVVVDETVMASGRAGDMNHVFMNVIDNALRAVGAKGTVDVHGGSDGKCYVVTVADSGPGIPPEDLERVFEPFYTTRAAGEGTGLGLSIARQIMQEHAGTITAGASELGGALLTIRLPLRATQRAVA